MTTVTISESPITVAATEEVVTVSVSIQEVSVSVTEGASVDHDHDDDYEPVLGNPGTDGYVLSSTAAGVRSWIEMMAGGGVEFPWQPDSDGTHSILQNAAGTNDVMAVDTSNGDIIVDGDASFRPDANTTNWGFLADASGTPFAFADTTNKEVRFGVGTDVIFIGPSAGRSSSGTSVVAIGPFAAFSNTGNGILAFGQAAGQQNTGAGGTYIGLNSGKSSSATNAVCLGRDTGDSASGLNPIFIGAYAGKGASNATNVTAIGFYAYQGATGTFNVAIGEEAGRSSNAGSCIYIGRLQGKSNTTSNRLLVGNNSTLSLLDGTMGTTTAAQALKINANTITLGTLPTSDPAVAGQLWSDGGTLKISAG